MRSRSRGALAAFEHGPFVHGRDGALIDAEPAALILCAVHARRLAALREHGLRPEIEPEHPKLGYLVGAIAEQAPALLARKRANH